MGESKAFVENQGEGDRATRVRTRRGRGVVYLIAGVGGNRQKKRNGRDWKSTIKRNAVERRDSHKRVSITSPLTDGGYLIMGLVMSCWG